MNGRQEYSKAIVKLLKGTVYGNDAEWKDIITYRREIMDYLSVIGLDLIVNDDEKYAFLKQIQYEDDKTLGLVTRTRIGYEVSVVLIVLRHILDDHDSDPTTRSLEKIITNKDIEEEVKMLFPKKHNEVRFLKDLNKYISKAEEYGFLKKIREDGMETVYKIERIIKDQITVDKLAEFERQLNEYDGSTK